MVGGGHLDLVETVFHTLGGEGVDGVGEFIAKGNPVIHGELADLHLEMQGIAVGIISVPSGREEAVLGIKRELLPGRWQRSARGSAGTCCPP